MTRNTPPARLFRLFMMPHAKAASGGSTRNFGNMVNEALTIFVGSRVTGAG